MPGIGNPPRLYPSPASTSGINSGDPIVARPRGDLSASRNCAKATADAAGERPGITRFHKPPNEPARRVPWFAGMSSTRRYAA
jgi:hypothetical protein